MQSKLRQILNNEKGLFFLIHGFTQKDCLIFRIFRCFEHLTF